MTQPTLFDVPVSTPKPNPVARERARLNAAALRVLARLKEGPATNVELCHPSIGGMRAVGRIHELRCDGWGIDKSHLSGGTWLYTLLGLKGQSR